MNRRRSSMWTRKSAQERQAAALAFLREHGFYAEALELAGGDDERVAETVAYAVVNALRTTSRRADELLTIAEVWSTTAWRHPWLDRGRRLRRAVDLVGEVERLGEVDLFNRAAELRGSSLRLLDVSEDER